MTETKRKRIVYGIFVVTVIWGIYNEPWKGRSRSTETADETPTVQTAAAVNSPTATRQSRITDILEDGKWTVDPFRLPPPSSPASAPTETRAPSKQPVLQGTMSVRGERVCVLDGRVYNAGDKVGHWSISHIGEGTVTLTGSHAETLQLRVSSTGPGGS